MVQIFADRRAAGVALAETLRQQIVLQPGAIALALPRGGVPVAAPIASALGIELDIVVARKLGVPGYEELAMGAICDGDIRVLNDDVIALRGITEKAIETVTRRERIELERRMQAYRGSRPSPVLEGRQVLLVDDGLATGATMRAAIAYARARQAGSIMVAVPVAAPDTARALAPLADQVICVAMPEVFFAIGQFYADFGQTSDNEVITLLQRAWTQEARQRS